MNTDQPANLVEKAIAIAVNAHRGQADKSGAPYILHPLRIMCNVDTDTERIVAILHDVIEDTSVMMDDLQREGFPAEVLDALACVTKKHDDEDYMEFVRRAASNPVARRVKLADLEDNMDARRLSKVTEKDAKRMTKYLRAWRYLKSSPELPRGVLAGPDEG